MGPIKKRKKDKVKVHYNTKKVGAFHKTITVYSNASNPVVKLQIKGKVLPAIKAQSSVPYKEKTILNTDKK